MSLIAHVMTGLVHMQLYFVKNGGSGRGATFNRSIIKIYDFLNIHLLQW